MPSRSPHGRMMKPAYALRAPARQPSLADTQRAKAGGKRWECSTRHFRLSFATLVLQTSSRNASRENWLAEPKPARVGHKARLRPRRTSARQPSPAATQRAKAGSGSGSHTHLKKFMRLLSVLWSSFPQWKLVESVGNAPLCGIPHKGAYADIVIMRTCDCRPLIWVAVLPTDVRIKVRGFPGKPRGDRWV